MLHKKKKDQAKKLIKFCYSSAFMSLLSFFFFCYYINSNTVYSLVTDTSKIRTPC